MDKRMLVIFVAGKYKGNIPENIETARYMSRKIWELGFTALTPHLNTAHFEEDCHCVEDDYILGDLSMLSRCDGIMMIEGWKDSQGAMGEHLAAKQMGIPTFYSLTELKKYNWEDYVNGLSNTRAIGKVQKPN
jgi:hypothetical protein